MKRLALAALLALLIASPALAGSKACTATLVTAGYCATATDRLVYLSVANADVLDLGKALAAIVGWAATVTCTQAMVDLSQCTAPQLGQQVANPVTLQQAADQGLRLLMVHHVRAWREQQAWQADMDALRAHQAAIADPTVAP